jgi:hypothetical protein
MSRNYGGETVMTSAADPNTSAVTGTRKVGSVQVRFGYRNRNNFVDFRFGYPNGYPN